MALARQSSRLFSRFLTPRTFLVSAFFTSGSLTGALELIVTAHSIDFGTKAYANLLELAEIQRRVADALEAAVGKLLFRITSAHVYERDLEAVLELVEDAQAH